MNSSQFFKILRTAHLLTQHNIPYNLNLQHPCYGNLKSCTILCKISDFFHVVVEVVAYTALVGSCIPVFWDNLSVPCAREGQTVLPLKKGLIGCSKNLANKYHVG